MQGSAYYGLQAKSYPIFVNKVLLTQSPPISVGTVYGCFDVTTPDLSSCNSDHLAYDSQQRNFGFAESNVLGMQETTKLSCDVSFGAVFRKKFVSICIYGTSYKCAIN